MNAQAPQAGTISAGHLAKLLMLSPERIRQLGKAGHLPRAGRGNYLLVGAVQGYVKYLKEDAQRAGKSAAEDRVRDARAAEIERRMAREDREIVDLDEAIGTLEDISGLMLATLGSLPAMITRNPSERRRIENIVHAAQKRLVERFAQKMAALQTGEEDAVSGDEDE
jgi:hypothetical protein